MTDNEIIKALECCSKPVIEECCLECPYHLGGQENCHKLLGDIIDLINRKQAEIEKLKGSTIVSNIMESQRIKREAKAEAYKEFAERLNEKAQIADCFDSYNMVVGTHFIDNLLKEMVGEKE